ncbi:MAG: DUF2163 domain-containing protein [Roseibium sp.]
MKTLPESLEAHIAGRVTTLAACWIVTRKDTVRLGFTDHDRALTVDGIRCQPESGLSTTAMTGGPQLATGGGEVAGALSSPALSEDDLEAGLWDHAEVGVYLVNWQQPADHVLLRRARIGEITRAGDAFQAELRGLAHLLEARQGREFSKPCDADLGDTRCKVELNDPAYQATGTVLSASFEWVRLFGFSGFEEGWFTSGRLEVLDGPLAGFASEVASHRNDDGAVILALFQPAPKILANGTAIKVRAGCDKSLVTCKSKFANHLNFQGFPHMPGTDFALSYPNRNTGKNDGSALAS